MNEIQSDLSTMATSGTEGSGCCGGGGGGHYREVGVLYNNFSYGVQQFMLTVSHNDNPIIDFVYRLTEYAKKLE